VVGDQKPMPLALRSKMIFVQLEHGNGIDAAEGFRREDKSCAGCKDQRAISTRRRSATGTAHSAGGADVAEVELMGQALGRERRRGWPSGWASSTARIPRQ